MKLTNYESLIVELFKGILSKINSSNFKLIAVPNEAVDIVYKNRTVIIYSYFKRAAILLNTDETLLLNDPEFSSKCIKYLNGLI